MLVGTNDGRVDEQMLQIGFAAQSRRKPFPDTLLAPAREANEGPVPMPQFLREIAPRTARAHDPQHRFDETPIVLGRNTTVGRLAGQELFNALPLVVAQHLPIHS